MKSKRPFKWLFMETIPAKSPKLLRKDTTFANYLLIVDARYVSRKIWKSIQIWLAGYG